MAASPGCPCEGTCASVGGGGWHPMCSACRCSEVPADHQSVKLSKIMASVRRKLRVFATSWLVLQVAWLTLLVPRDCCAAHRPVSRSEHGAHQPVSATQCPMRTSDGRPCAMHRGNVDHRQHHNSTGERHQQAPATPDECSLRGTCGGPMAALLAFQSNHGILPASTAVRPDVESRSVATVFHEDLIGLFHPPDPPPPRS